MYLTPIQAKQVQLALATLFIAALSAAHLPELLEYIFRRWMACDPIDSALEWVPIVESEFIPLLRATLEVHGDPRFEQEIIQLTEATHRCMALLQILDIQRHGYTKPFFSWTWPGESDLIAEVKAEMMKVRDAYFICESEACRWLGLNQLSPLKDIIGAAA